MGCGGSRMDALEPRYRESWTKDTESTWLTSTDTDVPLSAIQNLPPESPSLLGRSAEKNNSSVADFFEDSFAGPAQAYVMVCSAVSEASLSDDAAQVAAAVPASQHPEALSAHGPALQRKSMTCAEEVTEGRDDRTSTRHVTVTVPQRGGRGREGAQRGDRGGWRKETSRTSFQVLRPTEEPKEVPEEKSPK